MGDTFKILNSCILFASFLFGCKSSTQNNDWTAYKLKGKVKSIEEQSHYFSKSQKSKSEEERPRLISFDSKGYISHYAVFELDGSVNSTISTTYFDTYSIDSVYDSNNILLSVLKRTYNDKGKTLSIHSSKGLGDQFENGYNAFFKYDDNNNLIEDMEYNNRSKLISKRKYKYNKENKRIELREYNSLSQCEGYETYEYDSNGNEIESKYYNTFFKAFTQINTYQYNSRGDIVQQSSNELTKKAISVSNIYYVYDKNENWTKKTIESNTGQRITTRQIIYH